LNKLEWGIVALCVIISGVTVYSFTQITTLQAQVNSLNLRIIEKDETINVLKAESSEGKIIKIGYIASSTKGLVTDKPYLEQIIQPDMNAYCKQMGKNVTFQFQIEDAQGQAAVHLEIVQEFKNQGISVFIGGLWSSQACGSMSYVNINHMLMLSPSSTSPSCAIADDRFYRMCPIDNYTAPALVEMLWSYGIRHVCFVQRGDSWGDGIKNLFEPAWKAKGGDFLGAADIVWDKDWSIDWITETGTRYNVNETDFSDYLDFADQQISIARKKYSAESIGGVLLSFDEAPLIISQAKNFPNVSSTIWFGADRTAKSNGIISQAPDEASQMKLFSFLPSVSVNRQYQALERRYTALTGLPLGGYSVYSGFSLEAYNAYLYDSAMIIAKAMLLADSGKADDIVNLIQPLCDNYYGVSGSCSLNEFGDRLPPPYDIWGYGVVEGKVEFVRYGGVDPLTSVVSWVTGSR
jgi:ABC-type branched-subunit amino acid transport system substrate-binding protein